MTLQKFQKPPMPMNSWHILKMCSEHSLLPIFEQGFQEVKLRLSISQFSLQPGLKSMESPTAQDMETTWIWWKHNLVVNRLMILMFFLVRSNQSPKISLKWKESLEMNIQYIWEAAPNSKPQQHRRSLKLEMTYPSKGIGEKERKTITLDITLHAIEHSSYFIHSFKSIIRLLAFILKIRWYISDLFFKFICLFCEKKSNWFLMVIIVGFRWIIYRDHWSASFFSFFISSSLLIFLGGTMWLLHDIPRLHLAQNMQLWE